jgi:hypothetical protein
VFGIDGKWVKMTGAKKNLVTINPRDGDDLNFVGDHKFKLIRLGLAGPPSPFTVTILPNCSGRMWEPLKL